MSRTRHAPADEPFFLVRSLAASFEDGLLLALHDQLTSTVCYTVVDMQALFPPSRDGTLVYTGWRQAGEPFEQPERA